MRHRKFESEILEISNFSFGGKFYQHEHIGLRAIFLFEH